MYATRLTSGLGLFEPQRGLTTHRKPLLNAFFTENGVVWLLTHSHAPVNLYPGGNTIAAFRARTLASAK